MNDQRIQISHADAERTAAEQVRRAAEADKLAAKRAREHVLQRLRAEAPSWLARGSLGADEYGSVTQQFSGAAGCGCSKPDAFASIQKPTPNRVHHEPKNPTNTAQQLARRVNAARFATSKAKAVVLFDQNGAVLGLADPKAITAPDARTLIAFDQTGRPLGMIARKDIAATAVPEQPQQPAALAQPAQPQQPDQPVGGGLGGQLGSRYRR